MKKPQAPRLSDSVLLYRPLIVITGIALLGAAALAVEGRAPFMDSLMGLFLCFLAALKLFNLRPFAATFSKYDPLAARIAGYGLVYPFLELAAGALYLSGLLPMIANGLTLALFGINALGVAQVVRSGAEVQCGCVGTGFNLPVGRVTLFENLAMICMVVFNIF